MQLPLVGSGLMPISGSAQPTSRGYQWRCWSLVQRRPTPGNHLVTTDLEWDRQDPGWDHPPAHLDLMHSPG